jgi:hypothetical protein
LPHRNQSAIDQKIVQRGDAEVSRRDAVIDGAGPDHDGDAVGIHTHEGAPIDPMADPADGERAVSNREHFIAQTQLFDPNPTARR